MAVVAIIAAGNVGRVFTRRSETVMAGAARAQNLGVIDRRGRCKGDRAVAVLADIGRLHVCRGLARSGSAVVAAHAVPSNTCVIEYGREPGAHSMAIVALVVRRNMGWRLPGRLYSIVATDAAAGNGGVIHKRDDGPTGRNMTV